MAIFTTKLAGRNLDKFQPSPREANDMLKAGFRFEVFDAPNADYRILSPYRVMHNVDRDTLTVEQS